MSYQKFNDALTQLIRPQTSPLGIKILSADDPVEAPFTRPEKYGIKISLCQWVTMARRWNRPLAVLGDDINCSPCLASLGFMKMKSPEVLANYFINMGYCGNKDLALKAAAELDPLPAGSFKGVLIFPLAEAPLAPDLVVIYGTPAQMARLVAGFVHQTGELVRSATTGFGISCLSMMKPHWTGKPLLVVPGRGERILAGTEDNEMYCSFPGAQLESLLEGLEQTQKSGTRYPVQRYIIYQPPEVPAFKALNKEMEVV
jgi:uncharacterized protein (DUF169 family)